MLWWSASWLAFAALWMLLVDSQHTDELVSGAVCAAIAASASELVRAQRIAQLSVRLGWLARAWRPLARVPADLWILTVAALRQAVRPRRAVGSFRAVAFSAGDDTPPAEGRRALAQALGSFAPNTIVVGVDRERDLLLVHQLRARGGAGDLDPLELG